LQYNDDKKFDNIDKRKKLYDIVKLPLFVASITLLLKNINYKECYNEFKAIFIVANPLSTPKSNITNVDMPTPIANISNLPIQNLAKKMVFDNVITEQPDW
jgi:hypothetical protein